MESLGTRRERRVVWGLGPRDECRGLFRSERILAMSSMLIHTSQYHYCLLES